MLGISLVTGEDEDAGRSRNIDYLTGTQSPREVDTPFGFVDRQSGKSSMGEGDDIETDSE